MRVKKIPMNGYDAYLYKTDKYTTIHLNFVFQMEYSKDNMYKCDLLKSYLLRTNNIYKTKSEIQEKIRTFYNMGIKVYNYNIGKKMFIELSYNFYDPKLLKDDYLNDALQFAYDMIFKPRFDHGKLDEETLFTGKSNMIGSFASISSEPKYKARIGFLKSIFPNTYMTEEIINGKEEYEKLLNSFTDKDLIDFYNKTINDSFIGLTIMGNVDEAFLNNIKKLFVFKNVKKIDKKFNNRLKLNNQNKLIKHTDNTINESILYVVYNIKNYRKKQRYIYQAIINMLNSSGKVIRKTLRDELNLVYSAGASFDFEAGCIIFDALINRNNYDKCLEAFDLVLKKLKDTQYIEELLDNVKKQLNMIDYISDENKWNMESDLFIYAFKTTISRKRRNNIINKITVKEILDACNNLEREVIYFYEGTKNGK